MGLFTYFTNLLVLSNVLPVNNLKHDDNIKIVIDETFWTFHF